MGVFVKRLVPVDEIIADLVDMIDEEALRMKPTLYKWAMAGDKRIRTYYEYKRKFKVETVCNCQIPIPCDAVYIYSIIIGDPGCDCEKVWRNIAGHNGHWHNESFFPMLDSNGSLVMNDYIWSDGGGYQRVHFDWQIQGDDIVIQGGHLNGRTVTILYCGYQENKDGQYLVWDTHVDPISLYLKKFLADKEQWRNFKKLKLNKYEMVYIGSIDTAYHQAVRHCRANDTEVSPPQEDQIFNMINNPLSGRGNLYL
jgi:hypothetical protein